MPCIQVTEHIMATEVQNEETYLQAELSSLGIECKRKNEFNDKKELEALANAMKEVYFQDFKTAHNDHDDDKGQRELDVNKPRNKTILYKHTKEFREKVGVYLQEQLRIELAKNKGKGKKKQRQKKGRKKQSNR